MTDFHHNHSPQGALASAPCVGMGLARVALMAALAVLVSGCGLKGDLYLPDKATAPVITSGATQSSSSSSAPVSP